MQFLVNCVELVDLKKATKREREKERVLRRVSRGITSANFSWKIEARLKGYNQAERNSRGGAFRGEEKRCSPSAFNDIENATLDFIGGNNVDRKANSACTSGNDGKTTTRGENLPERRTTTEGGRGGGTEKGK